jgi:hypothetical protein
MNVLNVALVVKGLKPEKPVLKGVLHDGFPVSKLTVPATGLTEKYDLKPGQVVIAEGVIHDTKKENPYLGVAFVRCHPATRENLAGARLTTASLFPYYDSNGTELVRAVMPYELREATKCMPALTKEFFAKLWLETGIVEEVLLKLINAPLAIRQMVEWDTYVKGGRNRDYCNTSQGMYMLLFSITEGWQVEPKLTDIPSNRDLHGLTNVIPDAVKVALARKNKPFPAWKKLCNDHRELLERHPLWKYWQMLDPETRESFCRDTNISRDALMSDDAVEFFSGIASITHGFPQYGWMKGTLAFNTEPTPVGRS